MINGEPYDLEELKRLWKMKYKDLALAPGRPGARLREARFILQVKVASEAQQIARVMLVATIVMTVATLVMAIATLIGR